MTKKSVFLSYSWDSEEHRAWVRKLADCLEEHAELHVIWDGYDLDSLTDKNKFMESGVAGADYVVVIATKAYKKKADSRTGGVGIETYLTTASHWDSLQASGKSKLLVALREADAIPTYLKGHLYIDFTQDSGFVQAEDNLIRHFKGRQNIPRPQKRRSLLVEDGQYSFTKVEDLIRIGHPNRRVIVDSNQGTDFSGANRIKYELWETRSPALSYYLALATSSNITQTTNHAIQKFKSLSIQPTDLTVLRPRSGRAEQSLILTLFQESGLKTKLHEFTYKEYIWQYCIDESLKGIAPPSEIPNYTEQSISYDGEDDATILADSARDHLVNLLQQPAITSAHLVIAPGGMGKTSLCIAVAAKLFNRNDLRSSAVLIQAESVKRYIAENGASSARIDTIYQLYELYARYLNFDQVFDRNTFELAFLSGNLVVIIDGLDEFVSLFPDTFNLDTFLKSLANFHDELGSSAVLITTRNSQLLERTQLDALNIERHELFGFDSSACKAYLSRRFRKYSDGEAIASKVFSKIDKVQMRDHEARVVPFFADVAATVAEEAIRDNDSAEFDITDGPTPYPSNNDLTDHIIHSVMRREEVRQELDLSVVDVVQLIVGLVADYSKRWPRAEMLERLTLLYDARGAALAAKIALNPLLLQTGDSLELRYGFLSSYFEVLQLLQGILGQSIEKEFIRSLGRLNTDSNEFKDLKRFFSLRRDELIESSTKLVVGLNKQLEIANRAKSNDAEGLRRAIASVLNLATHVCGGSTAHITELVLRIYQVQRSSPEEVVTLSGLQVHGDLPAMDFSNLTIVNAKFSNYKNLLAGKFDNSKFMYCTFDLCHDPLNRSSSLKPQFLDKSCELGDLREYITLSTAGKQDENRVIEAEARKFLHSFFRGSHFDDNRKGLIRFSTKVPGLADNKFDRIIAEGFLAVSKDKKDATFFEIADWFRPSVRRFLTDNYNDVNIRKFLLFIRG